MKLTNNSILPTTAQQPKPLAEQFKGIEKSLRFTLLACKALQITGKETDKEILQKIDALLLAYSPVIALQKENESLRFTRAVLMVDKAIREGVTTAEGRLDLIELATTNFETTKAAIYNRHQTKMQLEPLLQLSWDELYQQDKLGQLKQVSFSHFKQKYKDRYGKEYPASTRASHSGKMQFHSDILPSSLEDNNEAANELQELLRLNGKELHRTGKWERLKQLSMTAFNSKFKECFKVEYQDN